MITTILGWIGSLAFTFAGLPQAIKCIREKHSHGLSWGMLGLWWTGSIFCSIYVLFGYSIQWPLLINYLGCMSFISIMTYYKIFPTTTSKMIELKYENKAGL